MVDLSIAMLNYQRVWAKPTKICGNVESPRWFLLGNICNWMCFPIYVSLQQGPTVKARNTSYKY